MKDILVSFQFLTKIPLRFISVDKDELARSVSFFPLVGMVLGFVLVFIYVVFSSFLNSFVLACLLLLVSVFMTGGLHIDGLSDTIDGLYGSRDRYTILNIMKDEHIGAMGAIAIVLVLLFKFSLYSHISRNNFIPALIISNTLSRWAMTFSCIFFNPAKDEGLGNFFIGKAMLPELTVATGILLPTLFITKFYMSLGLFIVIFLISILFNTYITRRIGGLTGDTLGALSEFAEVLSLFVLISLNP